MQRQKYYKIFKYANFLCIFFKKVQTNAPAQPHVEAHGVPRLPESNRCRLFIFGLGLWM